VARSVDRVITRDQEIRKGKISTTKDAEEYRGNRKIGGQTLPLIYMVNTDRNLFATKLLMVAKPRRILDGCSEGWRKECFT
jgi:hypothetical protein